MHAEAGSLRILNMAVVHQGGTANIFTADGTDIYLTYQFIVVTTFKKPQYFLYFHKRVSVQIKHNSFRWKCSLHRQDFGLELWWGKRFVSATVSFSPTLQQGDSIYPSANGPEVKGDTLSRLHCALSLQPHLMVIRVMLDDPTGINYTHKCTKFSTHADTASYVRRQTNSVVRVPTTH